MLTLQTDRFIMRPFVPEDVPQHFLLNSDPQVVRYTGDSAWPDMAAAEAFFADYNERNYDRYGTGRLACIRKSDGAWVGWCGIKYEAERAEYDLGYRFHQQYWGQGIASETAIEAVRFAFEHLEIDTLVGRAATANAASIAVLNKVGMQFVRHDACGCDPGEVWAMDNERYKLLTTVR